MLGRDTIVYWLGVLQEPRASLSVASTSTTSMTLSWKRLTASRMAVIEWVIFYKGQSDADRMQYKTVDGIEDGATLDDLHCGSAYELQIQGRNQIGKGAKSATIRAMTRGSAPILPDVTKMFSWLAAGAAASSAALILHADHWPSAGCPVNYVEIETRRADDDSTSWRMLAASLNADEQPMYAINNINIADGEAHQLRMTAYSDAGHLALVVDVQRLVQANGSVYFSVKSSASASYRPDGAPFTYETMIVAVSMAVSCAVLLCSVVTIVYVLKKK